MAKQNPLSSALEKYLGEQAKYTDSPYRKFANAFSLAFILRKLEREKRKAFIKLLEEEKFEQVLEYLDTELPELIDELPVALEREIEKIKKSVTSTSQESPSGPPFEVSGKKTPARWQSEASASSEVELKKHDSGKDQNHG